MLSRIGFPVVLGSLGLVALSVVAAGFILQSCALSLPFLQHLSSCPTDKDKITLNQLEASAASGLDLKRRIFELERELAAMQCARKLPDPTAPLSDEGWKNRDISMLIGCWDLETTYRTRDVDTGEIRTYNKWQMCFDAKGVGTQKMQSTDGVVCEGPVRGAFNGNNLSLIEPGNLACAGGGYIHQREISCVPAPNGRAICDTLQPETNGKASVGFERARE